MNLASNGTLVLLTAGYGWFRQVEKDGSRKSIRIKRWETLVESRWERIVQIFRTKIGVKLG